MSTTVMAGTRVMTTGEAARRLGAPDWAVRRVYLRGMVQEPETRAGCYRLIPEDHLPRLEAALREAGYLRES